ncbi:hypothetical protein QWI17_20220 [Gilvimarinus sp. SDUM040013]|uniref:Fimbrial assembly protein n=1 Tax=Gilvimarinus gilvus TaxID=3058038 RepID=A0ABU4RVN7_9GAMM|nr:hypothetical protein [Gilvimarinus sp. SDUM040013]MDO3388183.1 hypothetical protein [Gilvimarinus sp. SDUM040013]MDX6847733.1 hypothetical protein [Gilvimarinus sp. SDUM040013]
MQSINLYTSEFQPDRSPLQLKQIGLVGIVLVVLLVAISVWYEMVTANLRDSFRQAERDIAQLEAERDAFARASQSIQTEDLDQTIVELRETITERLALARLIGDQDLGNDQGFSQQMTALANYSSERLSLQGFKVGGAGLSLTMQGQVIESADAASFLDDLQADEAFADTRFGLLSIVPEPPAFGFVVSRPPQPDDEEGQP